MSDPTRADTGTQELLDGRYVLGECLGEGGMARVHRAEDVVLGRVVAVKMMRESSDPALDSGRLRTESTLLASLAHPSLVTLYDARIVPGERGYLVMELVEGPSLRERTDSGPLPATAVAALGRDLADALATVHAAGIVHRDVKPSNILLAPPGASGAPFRAKLADFGIAYLTDATRLTAPGTVLGTAAYLAPEQVRGAPAGPAADIYALGLVLLESLTGDRAFPHSSGVASVVVRLSQSPGIPDSLPRPWRELLAAMTAMDPFARPSAAAVVDAVTALDAAALAFFAADMPPAPAPDAPEATRRFDALPADAPASASLLTPEGAPPHTRAGARSARRRRRPALVWGAVGASAAGILALALALAPGAGDTVDPAPSISPVAEDEGVAPTDQPSEDESVPETVDTVPEETIVVDPQPDIVPEAPAEPAAPIDAPVDPPGQDNRGPGNNNGDGGNNGNGRGSG
ncbi:serine/threonine-protein kinase [Microbacterium sp. HA-8]|uniref:serine/threonine-protein kinase n=1 Tax=Microbacterium sp. HA-8 TaxID=3234200 RepID=UPI0038F781ED